MADTKSQDLPAYCRDVAQRAKAAAVRLVGVGGAQKNQWLRHSAELLRSNGDRLTEANAKDLAAAPDYGLTDAAIDRLRLTAARIESMAVGLEEVAALANPIGQLIESSIRPNGLRIDKVRVPLGVVFFVYE